MFCPQCGHQAENNEQYCSQCGTKLSSASGPINNNVDPLENNKLSPSVTQSLRNSKGDTVEPVISKKFLISIVIVTAFIPLIGIIMGILYLHKEHPEEKKAGKTWLITAIGFMMLNVIVLSMNN